MNDEALARYLTPLLSKHPAMLSELACSADLPMKSCLRSGAVLGVEAVLFEKLLAADDAELSKLLHLAAVGFWRRTMPSSPSCCTSLQSACTACARPCSG